MEDQFKAEDVGVIEGLAVALKQAAEALKKSGRNKFYLVIASMAGKPTLVELDDVEQCKSKLLELHQTKKDYPLFVYMFEGQKWSIRNNPLSVVSPSGQYYPICLDNAAQEDIDVI